MTGAAPLRLAADAGWGRLFVVVRRDQQTDGHDRQQWHKDGRGRTFGHNLRLFQKDRPPGEGG